jgi:large subunit ribosomal protein L22
MTGPKTNEGVMKAGERSGTRCVVRFARVSASKAREVLDLIRGLDVQAADDVLRFVERDVAIVIRKCLASAVANAQHNDGQDPEELYVSACFADEGPTLKRFRPRARGRATRIRKRTCHVTVIVNRLSDAELDKRRAKEATRPQAGRRAGRTAAAAAASRRERVARSRQAAAGQAGEVAEAEEIETEELTDELEGDEVTDELEEPTDELTEEFEEAGDESEEAGAETEVVDEADEESDEDDVQKDDA